MLPQARYLAKCSQHLTKVSLHDKNCLVIGATQGIGRAIALCLSSLGGNVTVSGRSKEAGSDVLSALRNTGISEAQKHSFERVDLTSQKDTLRFIESTSQKMTKHGGLDFLFLTAGKPPNGKQSLTADGIDAHFALQCLGRYSAAYGFAQVMNSGACITAVCAPGQGSSIPKDDLEYLSSENQPKYGMFAAASRDSMYVDAVLMELAKKHENEKLKVLHLFPGGVSTNAAQTAGFPFPIPQLARTFGPYVLTPAKDYAVSPVYEAVVAAEMSNGIYIARNQYGTDIAMKPWVEDGDNRKACIIYSQRRVAEALAR